MGNIFPLSVAQPPWRGFVFPRSLPRQPPDVSEVSPEINCDSNPGNMEDIHKKCRDIFPTIFEGAKLIVNRGLSSHFQVSHSLIISSVHPSGYKFGASYIGTNRVSPTEVFPILQGEIDPIGKLNANVIHKYENVGIKFAAQIHGDLNDLTQLSTDVKGPDYTASVTLGIIDIFEGHGFTVLNYLQNVTPSLVLGTEMKYQVTPDMSGGKIFVVSLAAVGKYTGKDYILSGSIGAGELHACYYRKGNKNIQVGVEVETNVELGQSVCMLGYQVDLPESDFVFRGVVDSDWTVGAVLEKKLKPMPFTLSLSGMIRHTTGESRFGIGLTKI